MRFTDWKATFNRMKDSLSLGKQILLQPKKIVPAGAILFGCFLIVLAQNGFISLPADAQDESEQEGFMSSGEESATKTAYVAIIDGEEVGVLSSSNGIQDAYLEAKSKVYVEIGNISGNELRIVEKEIAPGDLTDYEQVQDNMYQIIRDTVDKNVYVYKVSVGDRSFAFASREEIEQFFDELIAPYNEDKLFSAVVTEQKTKDGVENRFAYVDGSKAQSIRGAGTFTEDGELVSQKSSLLGIGLNREVQITRCVEGTVRVVSAEDAYALLEEPEEQSVVYRIEPGDSLSTVASLYGLSIDELLYLNPQVSYDEILQVGQEFLVSEEVKYLSVIQTVQADVQEEIPYERQILENDEWNETESVVRTEGVNGSRTVTYLTTYCDGEKSGKKTLKETVTKEPVSEVVEKGTIQNQTFIKPLYGGVLSSRYGIIDDGRTNPHHGIDWACPEGTDIFASKSGIVITSGYDPGDYGYMIEIMHDDGIVTRYAHLSQCIAQVGDYVVQGETIALSGNTGFTTGPHIHLEVVVNGVPVDPELYLVGY